MWWTVTYANPRREFNSDMLPLKLLPGLVDVNTGEGHLFSTQDMIWEVGPVKIDFASGMIFIDGKLEAGIPDVHKLILRKRNYISRSGRKVTQIHCGLVNKDGEGYLVRQDEDGAIQIEKCSVGVIV